MCAARRWTGTTREIELSWLRALSGPLPAVPVYVAGYV
jgi:hypothetical protein